MESYDNYGLDVNKNNKKDDKVELSAEERTEFENAFSKELKKLENERSLLDETNDLINEALEGVDSDDNSISPLLDNPLERNPLYKQMNDELKRKNILNSDPTGQQQKKAGEDI